MAKTHNNQQYWLKIRREMVKLDPEAAERDAIERQADPKHKFEFLEGSRKPIYLVALEENRLGQFNLSACAPVNAARMLVDGSHRLAEPAEAKAWLDQQATQKRDLEQIEAKKQQPLVTELVTALTGLGEQKRGAKSAA